MDYEHKPRFKFHYLSTMKKNRTLVTFLMLTLMSCNTQPSETTSEKESTTEGNTEIDTKDTKTPDEPSGFNVREPGDEELNEYGLITVMEDAGYPMYNVTVSFPERQSSNDFTLNAENTALSHEVNAFQDKYATLYYESNESNEVLDIIFEGKSLLGEYAPEDHDGLTKFEGLLKGATSESGDLPSELKIEGEEETLVFEYFVDAETMAANDQQVTVYFYKRYVDEITYLELSVD